MGAVAVMFASGTSTTTSTIPWCGYDGTDTLVRYGVSIKLRIGTNSPSTCLLFRPPSPPQKESLKACQADGAL